MRILRRTTLIIVAVCALGIIFCEFRLHTYKKEMAAFAEREAIYQRTIDQLHEIHENRRRRALEEISHQAELSRIIAREVAENPAYRKPATESAYAYDASNPKVVELLEVLDVNPCGIYITDLKLLANEAFAECGTIDSDEEVELFFWSVLWRLKSGLFAPTIEEILLSDGQYVPTDLTAEPSTRMLNLAISAISQYARYVNGDETVVPPLPDGYFYFRSEPHPEVNGWHNYYYAVEDGSRTYFEFDPTSVKNPNTTVPEMGGSKPPFSLFQSKM